MQLGDYPIYLDIEKQVSALFGRGRQKGKFTSLQERRKIPVYNLESVGTAGIIHSPALSRDIAKWNQWIDENIINPEIPI